MISVISTTNRPESKTSAIARFYYDQTLKSTTEIVRYFSLEDLPPEILHNDMYKAKSQNGKLSEIQDKYFIQPEKWILIVPEYNGGIPGIFKLLLDSMSVRLYNDTFKDKKVCLVGVSSGRAGNLRGLDYLTNVFHYLEAMVFPFKLPISRVQNLLDPDGRLIDELTMRTASDQIQKFCEY